MKLMRLMSARGGAAQSKRGKSTDGSRGQVYSQEIARNQSIAASGQSSETRCSVACSSTQSSST